LAFLFNFYLIKRNLHSPLYNFKKNEVLNIFMYLFMFYVLTLRVKILFATRIQTRRKNPTRSSTYATDQNIV